MTLTFVCSEGKIPMSVTAGKTSAATGITVTQIGSTGSFPYDSVRTYYVKSTFGKDYTSKAQFDDWVKGSGDLAITVDVEYSKFTGVRVNGIVVDNSNYTVEEGSTILKLKDSYLETLGAGDHVIDILFNDGISSVTLNISEPGGFP